MDATGPVEELSLTILEDILDQGSSRMIDASPPQYKASYNKLFQALAGHRPGRKETVPGRERREIFDEAVLELRGVLAHATPSQRSTLQRRRAELLRREA